MDASSHPSDAERELGELNRRAYVPHPEIEIDAAALARLMELEAARTESPLEGVHNETGGHAHASDGGPAADAVWTESQADRPDSAAGFASVVASTERPLRSPSRRLNRTAARRFMAGALVACVALGYTVAWLVRPYTDATLRLIADSADDLVVLMMTKVVGAEDPPACAATNASGIGTVGLCGEAWLAVLHAHPVSSRTVDGGNCVPPEVDLLQTPASGLMSETTTSQASRTGV